MYYEIRRSGCWQTFIAYWAPRLKINDNQLFSLIKNRKAFFFGDNGMYKKNIQIKEKS